MQQQTSPPATPGAPAPELTSILARQQEIREAIVKESAAIVAIKASATYRLAQLFRRFVPAAEPPPSVEKASPATSLTGADPVDDATALAAAELSRLEGEVRRISQELHRLQLSRPRRMWIAFRHRLQFVLHPLWSLGATYRVIANRGVLAQ